MSIHLNFFVDVFNLGLGFRRIFRSEGTGGEFWVSSSLISKYRVFLEVLGLFIIDYFSFDFSRVTKFRGVG